MRKLLFLILFPILLCSCPEVYCVNPVSDIQDAVLDEELVGTWVGCMKFPGEGGTATAPIYLHIGKMDAKRMKFISQLIYQGSIEEGSVIMHISKLDGRRFLNIRVFDRNVKPSYTYRIIEYEIKEKDTLLLRNANPDFVNNAICDQVLAGICHGILVGSESSEIRKFIRNSPKDQLFPMKQEPNGVEFIYCSFKRLKF